jgi:hypothetical protein
MTFIALLLLPVTFIAAALPDDLHRLLLLPDDVSVQCVLGVDERRDRIRWPAHGTREQSPGEHDQNQAIQADANVVAVDGCRCCSTRSPAALNIDGKVTHIVEA